MLTLGLKKTILVQCWVSILVVKPASIKPALVQRRVFAGMVTEHAKLGETWSRQSPFQGYTSTARWPCYSALRFSSVITAFW